MELPGLKQFRQEGSLSYLFFDAGSRQAVLIDPRTDLLEEYRSYLAEHRLTPTLVIDTRLHWHHLSGSHLFSEAYPVPIAMSHLTRSRRATRPLKHGDLIQVGRWSLTVLETPGVSPDAICLRGEGLLFTGDTIWAGAGARTDLPGADPAQLWRSLRQVVAPLPDSTILLPGLDAQEVLFSTLKTEKERGVDWSVQTEQAFVRLKEEEKRPRGDGDLRRRFEFNSEAHPEDSPESHFGGSPPVTAAGAEAGGVATISVDKYAQKVKERAARTCFLDVREPDEFRAGHVPGAINIPLSELSLHLERMSAFKRIYVSCQSGRRSYLAARTLDYLGHPDVVNVSGGFKAWENSGLPVE